MNIRDLKVVFFGTSEFGAIILEKLVQAGLSPVLVVTTPDKPVGRKQLFTPTPVKALIMKHKTWNIPILQPAKLADDTRYNIQDTKPDLFVVAAYGKILPKEILDIPKYGTLNVHPSLLPKYRGPSPIQAAILNGEDGTGVTIMLMDAQIDHGPIAANSKFKIQNSKFTYPELHDKLAEIGADLLIKMIPNWITGGIKPTSQDDSQATYTKILKKEDGRIDWNKEAVYIERQVRALHAWPGTFTSFKVKSQKLKVKNTIQNLKILKASVLRNMEGETGKTFQTKDGKLAVYTGKHALLIEELQLEGRKPMNSKEFLLGHKEFIDIQFVYS